MTERTLIINRKRRGSYYRMDEAHSHEAYEIYYLVFGTRKFFIGDTICYIKPGDLVVIPKGELHRTSFDSGSTHERIYVYFSENYLEELFERFGRCQMLENLSYPPVQIPPYQREYLENLFGKMEMEYERGDRFSDLLLRDSLTELLVFIMRCRQSLKQPALSDMSSVDVRMQEAARYIAREFRRNLTLGIVAGHMGLSQSYFSRKFKEATGFGFKEYLCLVRIRAASSLLLETKRSVTDIAFACGFNDSNYFGDTFRKMKGVSPSRYRNGRGTFM